jgi:hypothetical protein
VWRGVIAYGLEERIFEPYSVPIVLGFLFLVGLAARTRLAWRLTRWFCLAFGLWFTAQSVYIYASSGDALEPPWQVYYALMLGQGAGMLATFVVLGTRSARRAFRLICPRCDGKTARAANILFTEAHCRRCDVVW